MFDHQIYKIRGIFVIIGLVRVRSTLEGSADFLVLPSDDILPVNKSKTRLSYKWTPKYSTSQVISTVDFMTFELYLRLFVLHHPQFAKFLVLVL